MEQVFVTLFLLVTLLIGFLVLKSNSRSYSNQTFFVLIVMTTIWIASNYVGDHYSKQINARIVLDVINISSSAVVWSLYILSKAFPDAKNSKILINRDSLISTLPYALLCYLLVFTDLVVAEAIPGDHVLGVRFGPLSFIFLGFFISYFFLAAYNFIRKYRTSSGLTKVQIQYLFLGLSITAIITITTNLVFPLVGIIQFSTFGPFFVVILLGFTAFAMVRHQLFQINEIIARGLIYFLLISTVSLSFVAVTVITGSIIEGNLRNKILISVGVSLVIVFGLDPLKRGLSRLTDRFFFKAKVDYTTLLQRLSNIASLEINLQNLTDDLERGMIQGLKVKNALILLRDRDNGITKRFLATKENGLNRGEVVVENASPLVQFLREHRHLSLLESLRRRIEDTPESDDRHKQEKSKAEFEKLSAGLVAPIFSQDHLVAILTLGPKLSGDSFNNEDIHLIEVLTPQIGSAIQKANLYEEVRQFSEGLKVRVDEATKELRDRNISLQTLQKITKDITRTLDFNKVVQNIANAVATELGFLGAILILLDDDAKTLRARAVTETPLTKKAIKLLPKPFTSYTTELTNPKHHTLAFDVINTGEIRFTDSMPDVISPPIPKPIVIAMQKLMGIRTMILVPILSENKVIGVIEVGARRHREEISDREVETIQSMADELGVVARNISLFDRIRLTNDQLEIANTHLKQLDQAKSEFVSIASHQLRTPMTGIMGYLSMMTQGDFGKIKPEHQKILVDLLSESQRMIRLINQFLNVSKIEAGKFTYTWKPTQLEELVTHVVKEVEKPAADKGLKLAVKLPKKLLPTALADTDKVEDVILNLLDNAIKYTAKGSLLVTVVQEGEHLHFAVKDTGIGIKPADAHELFNKFVRGSGIAQIHPDGSGLGLFIAKSIIDAHGGRIWADSEGEGKGSTFQFTLPLKPPVDLMAPALPAAALVSKPRDDRQITK